MAATPASQAARRLRYDPRSTASAPSAWGWCCSSTAACRGHGGFLGVSVFFTLSGFLITSLLLAEHGSTGGVRLGHFWLRRLRRLMPAALACLVLILVLTATVLHTAKGTLRGDVLSALADVANWRFYFSGQSYANLFAVPSPVQHYWSLAIEEQFYLVFPLLVWLVLVKLRWSLGRWLRSSAPRWPGRRRRPSPSARRPRPRVLRHLHPRREILAGCLLAMALTRWGRPDVPERPAVGDVGARSRWPASSSSWCARHSRRLVALPRRAGRLQLLSVRSSPPPGGQGRCRSVLSFKPFVALGLISYGVYLYHWPLFLWLTPDRTGLDGVALLALRFGATLAVSWVSYRFLEEPIRRGRALTGWQGARVPPIAIACTWARRCLAASGAATSPTTAVSTLPPLPSSTSRRQHERRRHRCRRRPPRADIGASRRGHGGPVDHRAAPTTTTEPPPPARVVVFGDSTAKADAAGLMAWGADSGQAVVSDAGTIAGCGLLRTANDLRHRAPDGARRLQVVGDGVAPHPGRQPGRRGV